MLFLSGPQVGEDHTLLYQVRLEVDGRTAGSQDNLSGMFFPYQWMQ
jgi:hypothetical protein